MGLSKIQRFKVTLLLAAYLCVVLTHLQYMVSPRVAVQNQAYTASSITPRGYDESGQLILVTKKIYKFVINRRFTDNSVPQPLYITKPFHYPGASLAGFNLSRYTSPVCALQAKRCFYLRI
ncbi:hypothetical protein [Mucilaginibacter sp. UYCu711]|uniref:hypothetical protein n=1 Tax=Mucilaginibacter sp. UYCu711 TaxID=3156339 RepID=UPI003D1F6B3A